ncbi:PP2C family protein-serine/threonine phosphatase [Rhizobium halophytocola]|uniref:Serine/threonine protein phosphatase PrpC n=1 Tax=Rhizobium halophytocola TaxID=735519 RepID=A0ABS4E3K9_9HYPH|nr:protein phosphatase 2C domain-containing protein [Rhizobium halophytocola]MBP1852499.1 serine/threonine protein phosphatase PrpC [Rhizobium halophytocola]
MTPSSITARKRHSACTHVGLVRKMNEDSILVRPELDLWAVSDGMGGHAGGDYASQAVVDALARLSPDLQPAEVMHEARNALQAAHLQIATETARRGAGMIGATVVLLVLADEHFMCLWAGDSRLYRLRDGAIEMISTDHSVVGELVEQGYISWEEAETHPRANEITRAVGVGDDLEIDKRRGTIQPGDRFLLCSDGLSRYAGADVLHRLLSERPIETVADDLLQVALAGEASDNISVIVVDV